MARPDLLEALANRAAVEVGGPEGLRLRMSENPSSTWSMAFQR